MKTRLLFAALFGCALPLLADPLSTPVLERYEQMLLKAPEPGTAFDKIYQHYLETDGLDALARKWNEAAAKGGSDQAEYLLLVGMLADRRGQTDEALKTLGAAADAGKSWRPWSALAATEARAGKLESAVESYKKAIASNPPADAVPKLYRGLAMCQQRLMDTAGASETWRAYAKASPNDPFVLEEAGGALLEAGQYDQAREMFTALRDMKDADPARKLSSSLKLAEVEERRGNKKEALKIYTAALAEAGDAGWVQREVRARIEKLFRSDDDIPGLVAFYRDRLKAEPGDIDTALRLSDGLYELNRNEEALAALQAAAEKAPGNKDVQIKLAVALLRAERPAEAEKTLTAIAKILPDDPAIVEQLGEAQWQAFKLGKGDKSVAIATWRKLAGEKAEVNAVQHLAEIFRAHELADEAVAEYRRALRLEPAANDRRERLAEYLMQINRKEDAFTELAGMVAEGRASGENYLRLAKIQRRFGDVAAAQKSLAAASQYPERAFERDYLSWQIASEAKDWAAAEPLAMAMRQSAQNDPEMERADDCLVDTFRQLGKADGEIKRLLALRDTSPAGFAERDYRLLFVLAMATDDDGTAGYALAEGLKQFPKSAVLAKLDVAYAKRSSDMDRRIAALSLLEQLEPQRAGDWMGERVRAYRDAGKGDDAVALARKIVQQAPAKAETYLMLADTLMADQKTDDAVKTLQEAIPLSDTPNQIRLRLADIYLSQARYDAARQVLDDAFEAEETPAGKLQMTNRLASVYLQDGKVDDFIAKLRERQKAEQGGWRYALYLAEVYLMMQDSIHAMDELDKALAGQPSDPTLLKKLYGLADANGDAEAALRYARKLVEVEPTKQNRAELGESLAEDGKLDEALDLIKDNSAEFLDDPQAWQETVRILQAEDKTGDLAEMLEGKLRASPDDWKSLMTLAEVLMTSNQTEKAKAILWQIVAMKESAPPTQPSASPSPTPAAAPVLTSARAFRSGVGAIYYAPGMSMAPTQMRQMRFNEAFQQAQQMLSNQPQPNRVFRSYRGRMGLVSNQPTSGNAGLVETQDRAIVYLASMAMREGRDEEFLKKLATIMADRSPLERLNLYSMLQAPEPTLLLIKQFVDSGTGDAPLATASFQALQGIMAQRQNNPALAGISSDEELKAMASKLTERIAAVAQPQNALQRYQMLLMAGKKDEAEKLVDETLAQTDPTDASQLATAMSFSLNRRDFDKVLKYHDLLMAARAKSGTPRTPGQDYGLAMQLMNTETHREKGIDLIADEFSAPGGAQSGYGFGNRSQQYAWPQLRSSLGQLMPFPTRDLTAQQVGILRSFGLQNPQMRKFLPDLLKRFAVLATEKKSASLEQATLWLLWFSGKQDEAEAGMKALLAKQPDDDLMLNYSMMLIENKKQAEALKVLDAIKAKSGSTYEVAARLRFAVALRANQPEIAKDAALKLVALRLVDYEQQQLVEEMKRLGLVDEAAKLAQKATVSRNPGARTRQMMDIMRQRLEEGNRDEALTLAYAMLGRDPLSRTARDERYQQQEALRVLDRTGELNGYIAKLKTQLEAAPESIRLNIQLAQAVQIKDPRDAEPYYRKLTELRPKDSEWLLQLGNLLMQSEQNAEAMKLYDKILAENPALLFSQGSSFKEPYERTKSWSRLVEALKKAPEPRPDPLGGYQQNYAQIFLEIGSQLKALRPPIDPTDIWLKGLQWDPVGSPQMRPKLAQALDQQGRKEEARKVIEEAFFPPGRDESNIRLFVYNRQARPNTIWNQMSSYGYGEIQNAGVQMMHSAESLGFLKELIPRFDRLPSRPGEIDPKILARVVARDPAGLPAVREYLAKIKESKPGSPGYNANPQMLRIVADELADWPEGRLLAYEALDTAVQVSRNSGIDFMTMMMLQLQRAELAVQDNKKDVAQKALGEWLQALKDSKRQGSGMDISLGIRMAKLMSAAGMDESVGQLMEIMKSDPNYRSSQRMLKQAENEIAILQGKGGNIVPSLAWLPQDKAGRIIWDLRPASGDEGEDRTTWMTEQSLAKLSGAYTLDVYYGTSRDTMKRIFSKPAIAARGSWSGTLPAGNGFIRGVLRKGEDMQLGPAVAAAVGIPLLSASALAEVPKSKNGTAPGWTGIPPLAYAWEKGGPTGEGFLRIEGDRQEQEELVADRIPINPKKNYAVGCWFRYFQNYSSSRVGWRVYDAKGNKVSEYSADGNFQGDRWNLGIARLGRNSSSLPSNAAWLEPYIQFGGRCDLQGMFVTEVAAPLSEDD